MKRNNSFLGWMEKLLDPSHTNESKTNVKIIQGKRNIEKCTWTYDAFIKEIF